MRSASSFNRKPARYTPQPKILVLCEDTHSSLQYLQKAAQGLRAAADVKVAHAGRTDPLGIVKCAIGDINKYDEIYCVIDRDTHETFHQARHHVKPHEPKIQLIISNPCFEYWLLLHFRYTRSPFVRAGNKSPGDVALAELKRHAGMNGYQKGKGLDIYAALEKNIGFAKENAKRSMNDAKASDAFNPSTQIHEIIMKFEDLGKARTG